MALRAAFSAANPAAKGVPLRDPLNPDVPALAHASTLPYRSLIVTTVLLNVDWIWAIPAGTCLRSLRFPVAISSSRVPSVYDAAPAGDAFARRAPTVFRGPLRVRAFVRVRCPRTGRPRRWRWPR